MFGRLFAQKPASVPTLPEGRRVYAIGDIHGRLDLLDELLERIAADQADRDPIELEVIALGDLIDRGPDSAGVVRRLMNPPTWGRFLCLMGNHEATMLAALDGDGHAMDLWLGVGGRETLLSWGVPEPVIDKAGFGDLIARSLAAVAPEELSWLARLRQNIRIGDYFFVHAGVRPGTELERQSPRDSLWIRNEFLHSSRDHGAVVVHGHSITPEATDLPNRVGIDTGAYISGRLTALGIEGDRRWLLQTAGTAP